MEWTAGARPHMHWCKVIAAYITTCCWNPAKPPEPTRNGSKPCYCWPVHSPFSLTQNPWSTYIFRTCNFHMLPRPLMSLQDDTSLRTLGRRSTHLRSAFSMRLSTMAVQEARAVCWRILTTAAPSCCKSRKPWCPNRWSPSLWRWDVEQTNPCFKIRKRIPQYKWLPIIVAS